MGQCNKMSIYEERIGEQEIWVIRINSKFGPLFCPECRDYMIATVDL